MLSIVSRAKFIFNLLKKAYVEDMSVRDTQGLIWQRIYENKLATFKTIRFFGSTYVEFDGNDDFAVAFLDALRSKIEEGHIRDEQPISDVLKSSDPELFIKLQIAKVNGVLYYDMNNDTGLPLRIDSLLQYAEKYDTGMILKTGKDGQLISRRIRERSQRKGGLADGQTTRSAWEDWKKLMGYQVSPEAKCHCPDCNPAPKAKSADEHQNPREIPPFYPSMTDGQSAAYQMLFDMLEEKIEPEPVARFFSWNPSPELKQEIMDSLDRLEECDCPACKPSLH